MHKRIRTDEAACAQVQCAGNHERPAKHRVRKLRELRIFRLAQRIGVRAIREKYILIRIKKFCLRI